MSSSMLSLGYLLDMYLHVLSLRRLRLGSCSEIASIGVRSISANYLNSCPMKKTGFDLARCFGQFGRVFPAPSLNIRSCEDRPASGDMMRCASSSASFYLQISPGKMGSRHGT